MNSLSDHRKCPQDLRSPLCPDQHSQEYLRGFNDGANRAYGQGVVKGHDIGFSDGMTECQNAQEEAFNEEFEEDPDEFGDEDLDIADDGFDTDLFDGDDDYRGNYGR